MCEDPHQVYLYNFLCELKIWVEVSFADKNHIKRVYGRHIGFRDLDKVYSLATEADCLKQYCGPHGPGEANSATYHNKVQPEVGAWMFL